MEHRPSSPVAPTDQPRPAQRTSQSSLRRTSNELSIRAPSPSTHSLSAQSASAFDSHSARPSNTSPTPNRHSSEAPTALGVSLNPQSPEREKKDQLQVSTAGIEAENLRRASTLSQKYQRYVAGRWTWEIVSCMLAIGTLIALAVVLWRYDGHPQPTLPYKVSINTLVSIFSTVIKGLMLISVGAGIGQLKWLWFQKPHLLQDFNQFDQATQGFLGATKLLWSLRLKHLASLGAFIMVIAIAFEPFTQAVLQLHSCNVVLPSTNATIPRSNNYTASGAHTGAGTSTLNQPMQNAIYNGIYNSANTSQTSFQCSSGNCTFPTYEDISYQSVGVCSQCVDVSDNLSRNCPTSSGLCNITLNTFPDGIVLSAGEYLRSYPLLYTEYANASLPPESSIGHFSLIMYNSSYVDTTNTAYPLAAYFALECGFYTCAKSYNASIAGGTLTETVVDVALNLESYNPENASYVVPSPCVVNGSVIDGTDLQGDHPDDDAWQQVTLNGSSAYVLKECAYGISGTSWMAFDDFFPSLFAGYVDGIDSVGVEASPNWLSVIYDSGDGTAASISETVDGIATSMTNHMRQNGQVGNSNPAYGITIGTETCVGVKWGWIAFPTTAVVLTALFLMFTILQSRKHPGQLIWKAEVLPVLYHGLDAKLRSAAAFANRAEDMELYASTMTVHLQQTEWGWHLVDSQVHPDVVDVKENGGNRGV